MCGSFAATGVYCHVERSVAESKHLAEDAGDPTLAARFLIAYAVLPTALVGMTDCERVAFSG